MVKEDKQTWKAKYFVKANRCLTEYEKCFIVGVDNVRSKQMQQIRQMMRGEAEMLMGKNTMMKKVIRGQLAAQPQLDKLMPHIVENIGFVFTREDIAEIKDKILGNRVQAPAKAGAIAPCEVTIPAQNTGLGPEKTSFFQALQIPTKIAKGTIEILNDVLIIKEGDKVGASEATLLNMLKIYPFSYGLSLKKVYDAGTVFDPEVLDITEADMRARFQEGVRTIAALSMAMNYPNAASMPHMVANAFKNLVAVAVETEYNFPGAAKYKEYIADPSKFASAAPAAAAPAAAAAAAKPAAKDDTESEDEDMGFGLFD